MKEEFLTTVTINATSAMVWATLTKLELMSEWLGEPEMNIEVETNWKINSPIIIRGFHHIKFENKGVILKFEKEKELSYTHLSSVSRLADKTENYTTLDFILTPIGNQTQLTLTLKNFPTEVIRKHLEFYWRTTLTTIKKHSEKIS